MGGGSVTCKSTWHVQVLEESVNYHGSVTPNGSVDAGGPRADDSSQRLAIQAELFALSGRGNHRRLKPMA